MMIMTVNNRSIEDSGPNRTGNSEVVVGLFLSGEDAHRAIVQLQAEGFSASQIGAAFRSSAMGTGSGTRQVEGRAAGKDVARRCRAQAPPALARAPQGHDPTRPR